MLNCWSENSESRPTFKKLVKILDNLLNATNKVNFYHFRFFNFLNFFFFVYINKAKNYQLMTRESRGLQNMFSKALFDEKLQSIEENLYIFYIFDRFETCI